MIESLHSIIVHHRLVIETWLLFISTPLCCLLLMDQMPELPHAPRWLIGIMLALHTCFTLFITIHATITMHHSITVYLSWLVVVSVSMGYLLPHQED